MLGLVFPWTLWLIGGLAVPWLDREQPREKRWMPWLWFVVVFVVFSIPAAKQQRYILPIVAPAALLIGQLAVYLARRSGDEQAEHPTWLKYLIGAHGWVLLAASVGFGAYLTAYPWLAAHDWAGGSRLGEFPWRLGALLGLLLAAAAWLVVQRVDKGQFVRAAVWTGVWSALLGGVWWYVYDTGPAKDAGFRDSARRVAALVGDAPAYSYRPVNSRAEYLYTNKEFLFYVRRSLPALTLQEVKEKRGGEAYVLAPADGIADVELAGLGYEVLPDEFKGKKQPWKLWHSAAAAASQPAKELGELAPAEVATSVTTTQAARAITDVPGQSADTQPTTQPDELQP